MADVDRGCCPNADVEHTLQEAISIPTPATHTHDDTDHWQRRGQGLAHRRIHNMCEQAMMELGESPIEGRVHIICDAVYIGSQVLLEERLPWLAP